jgi:2-amino-4-hydroxy-6-hydroxymethyldihydropteridine diphosphokinase
MTTSSKKARKPRRRKRKKSSRRHRAPGALAYLALGSNRGGRRRRIEAALREISRAAPILAVSSFYRTDPVGHADQPFFWNAVAAVRWRGSAARLLALAQDVERRVGRTASFRNGPREIDVDVLDLGGRRRASPDPVLPHPRLSARRFVLAPLSEIAPEWRHPVSGKSAAKLLARLPARPGATRLSSRPRGSSAPAPGTRGPRPGAAAKAGPRRPTARARRLPPAASRRPYGGPRRGSGDSRSSAR